MWVLAIGVETTGVSAKGDAAATIDSVGVVAFEVHVVEDSSASGGIVDNRMISLNTEEVLGTGHVDGPPDPSVATSFFTKPPTVTTDAFFFFFRRRLLLSRLQSR